MYTDINRNKILVTTVVQFSSPELEKKNNVSSALREMKCTDIRKGMTSKCSSHFIYYTECEVHGEHMRSEERRVGKEC
jgi:hypothetical protein